MDTTSSLSTTTPIDSESSYSLPPKLLNLTAKSEDAELAFADPNIPLVNRRFRDVYEEASIRIGLVADGKITAHRKQITCIERQIENEKRVLVADRHKVRCALEELDKVIASAFDSVKPGQTFKVEWNTYFGYENRNSSTRTIEQLRVSQPGIVELLEKTSKTLESLGYSPTLSLSPSPKWIKNTGYDYESDAHWEGATVISLTCEIIQSEIIQR